MGELFTMLATAKQLGVSFDTLLGIVAIYFMLKGNQIKMSQQVDKIVKAIEHHNERLANLEEDVKQIKEQLKE
jgi:hypothetical protein